jgi:hypothetical protein
VVGILDCETALARVRGKNLRSTFLCRAEEAINAPVTVLCQVKWGRECLNIVEDEFYRVIVQGVELGQVRAHLVMRADGSLERVEKLMLNAELTNGYGTNRLNIVVHDRWICRQIASASVANVAGGWGGLDHDWITSFR